MAKRPHIVIFNPDQYRWDVQALKDAGIYDDTALFFFSDHGDFTGDYGLVEKTQNTFEDVLTRVPLLVKPPMAYDCEPGVRDELVELVDFTETVFDVTGIEPGYDRFGKSLLPLVAGEIIVHRDAVFCEGGRRYGEVQAMETESEINQRPEGMYWPRVGMQNRDDGAYHSMACMCRTQRFKFVRRLYEQDELYDLQADPGELHNLIHDPDYAQVRLSLMERTLDWYQRTCDVIPREPDQRN